MAEHRKPVYIQDPEQWEQLRPLITKLYLEDGLELPEVMREIEKEGFKANPGMFKQRFNKWGLTKHNKQQEVEIILRVKRDREALGKKTTFMLRAREVDMADIERYRKRKNIRIPDSPLSASDREKAPDLTWHTPPASPSPGLRNLTQTPSSGTNSYSAQSLSRAQSLPRAIASPTSLGHCEEYLRDTAIAFELFITSGFWKLSKSTEMPWSPAAVLPLSEPVMPEYYWQDECFRHLNNGVMLLKKGEMNMAFKEWHEAFFLISSIVQAAHYNTLGKLLACIRFLEQENHPLVSERFRVYVGLWARNVLEPGHPYLDLFCRLRHLASEDIEELQLKTQEFLVKKLETFLGPEAFTSFEHRMVLNEKILVKNPSLDIDASIPTNEECSLAFGPTSSKTMLALNMRNGILQHRGALEEAHDTCLMIIKNASMVDDPAKRLWHLGSAWVSLARLQLDLHQFHAMRLSLKSAREAEGELRNKHGLIKLGDGEMNWILETLGIEPIFRDSEVAELEMETLSLS